MSFFKPLIIANFKKPIKMTDAFFLVKPYGLIVLKAVLIFFVLQFFHAVWVCYFSLTASSGYECFI